MDSSQRYNLARSILEECKQATTNPDISDVVHLLNRVQLVPHLPPNPLVRLVEVLRTKQNESSDEALPLTSGTINKCAVLLSVILSYIFRNNAVGVLERSPRRVDIKTAIGLFRDGLELLPIHHPFRLPACYSVANALYTHSEQSGERRDLGETISRH